MMRTRRDGGGWSNRRGYEQCFRELIWSRAQVAVVLCRQRGMIENLPLRYRDGRCCGARRFMGSPREPNSYLAISGLARLLFFVRIVGEATD